MQGILDFLISLVDFIITQIRSILWTIEVIPLFAATFVDVFAYCPSFLMVFLEVSLALTLVFAIFKLL